MEHSEIRLAVNKVGTLVKSFRPARSYRKLRSILKALEVQVEDGDYQRHAVTRLCEALLASSEGHPIPEASRLRLESLACAVVDLAERRR